MSVSLERDQKLYIDTDSDYSEPVDLWKNQADPEEICDGAQGDAASAAKLYKHNEAKLYRIRLQGSGTARRKPQSALKRGN